MEPIAMIDWEFQVSLHWDAAENYKHKATKTEFYTSDRRWTVKES